MNHDAASFFRNISAKMSASKRSVGDTKSTRWKERKQREEEPQQPITQLPPIKSSTLSLSLQPQQAVLTVLSAVETRAVISSGNVCNNSNSNAKFDNIGGFSAGGNNNNNNDNSKDNNNNNNNNISVGSSCVVGGGNFALQHEQIKEVLLTQVQQASALVHGSSSPILSAPSCIYSGKEYGSDFIGLFSGNYGGNVDKGNTGNCGGSSYSTENISDRENSSKIHVDLFIAMKRKIQTIPKNASPIIAKNHGSLLPKQLTQHYGKKTLILDVDETLVHSSLKSKPNHYDLVLDIETEDRPTKVYVAFRPYLKLFLTAVAQLFEIVIFTASLSTYCNHLMNALDPEGILGSLRLCREHCSILHGAYVKDLSLLGRDLGQVAIVDNSPVAYLFQQRNAIPITSWFGDPEDNVLMHLLPVLEALSKATEVYDVLDDYNAIYQAGQEQRNM